MSTKNVDMTQEKQALRVGLFGCSGSGKTTKAKKLLTNVRRLIIIDPQREFMDNPTTTAKKATSRAEFIAILKSNFLKSNFAIIYCPKNLSSLKDDVDFIAKYIYGLQSAYGKGHFAKITLFIDEAQEAVPSGTYQKNPDNGVLLLARMGRKRGINLVIVSQRLNTVDINLRANLSDIFIFQLRELSDINSAKDIVFDKETLHNMKIYDYFHKSSNGEIKFYQNKLDKKTKK